MANKIQFRRGLKANLPTLSPGEPAVCTDTNEVFVGGSNGNIPLITPNENLLINGDFQVWQRGTSFTVSNETLIYTADRWCVYAEAGVTANITQDMNGLKIVCNGGTQVLYRMEQADYSNIGDKEVTLQYSINNTVFTSKYIPSIELPHGDNRVLQFTLGAGTHLVNFIKLERGSIATPINSRSYGMELMLSRRYYRKGLNKLTTTVACTTAGQLIMRNAYAPPMRITPTIRQIPGTALTNMFYCDDNNTQITPNSIFLVSETNESFAVIAYGSFEVGKSYTLAADIIELDAEIY